MNFVATLMFSVSDNGVIAICSVTDEVMAEKATPKRQHSAPEYLEKRKQDRDRRKSETGLRYRLRRSRKSDVGTLGGSTEVCIVRFILVFKVKRRKVHGMNTVVICNFILIWSLVCTEFSVSRTLTFISFTLQFVLFLHFAKFCICVVILLYILFGHLVSCIYHIVECDNMMSVIWLPLTR
jgi:hypothetical protein